MAEKKFAGIRGSVEGAEFTADYNAAQVFDKVRVGKLGVYFRDGFKTRFMAYDLLERVFIRINEVNGKLCCGKTVMQYFRMVFVVGGKELCDVISEDEAAMDNALECIRQTAPNVAIGFVK